MDTSFSYDKPGDEDTAFGTFIHRVFCAWRHGIKDDEANELIKRLALCYGFHDDDMQSALLSTACVNFLHG